MVFKRFSSLPVLNTLKIQVSAVLADSSLIMELVIFLLSLIFHDQFLACIKQMKIVHYNYNYSLLHDSQGKTLVVSLGAIEYSVKYISSQSTRLKIFICLLSESGEV